jgi:hypothetical protein
MKSIDVPAIATHWLDCDLLEVVCPYCERTHWHSARRSPRGSITPANCQQKHLPRRLRGVPLAYHLIRGKSPCEPSEVIPFPRQHVRGGVQGNLRLAGER